MSKGKYNVTIVFDNGEKKEILGVDDIFNHAKYLQIYIREGKRLYASWDRIVYYILEDLRTSEERYKDTTKGG